MARSHRTESRLLPWRYALFLVLLISMAGFALFEPWYEAVMAGFDVAAFCFLLTLWPLLDNSPAQMRERAARNDANRTLMLVLSAIISLVVLVAVAVELKQKHAPSAPALALVIATLGLAWIFSNMVFTLHYVHLYYRAGRGGGDSGGLDFSGGGEPRYWDFIYFAFTLGMTFQTSDTGVTQSHWRKVIVFHCLAAFVFNIGVLAFTINVLGSS